MVETGDIKQVPQRNTLKPGSVLGDWKLGDTATHAHFRNETSCVMNEWLNWEECEADRPEGSVALNLGWGGEQAGSFISSLSLSDPPD